MFVKGFALVAAEMPELRRIYLRMPWPHLYEYVDSTVCVMHERMIMGDLGLVPLRFHKPDAVPIQELSEKVRDAHPARADKPASQVGRRCSTSIVGSSSDHLRMHERSTAAPGAGNLWGLVGGAMAD